MSKYLEFPRDFVFGTATAAYQIEGATDVDGRGPSIWDTFSKTEGKTFAGHTGDVACAHYHRYLDDIALMKSLGIPAYRLSLAWPRIFPEKGTFNQAGIDFYRRLLESLQENGIDPAVTLYHWDLPQWLQDEGGWVNRDTAKYFAEYGSRIFKELGDLVPRFITHNEPWCAAFLGHGLGIHAPGHTDWPKAFTAAHHLLWSHGLATEAYRASGHSGEIGITLNFTWVDAASHTPEDVAAAQRLDGFSNRWFIHPLFQKEYPADMTAIVSQKFGDMNFIKSGDLDTIGTSIDFLGVNYYTRSVVEANPADPLLGIRQLAAPEDQQTEMGWEIHPESLYKLLSWIRDTYTEQLPLFITENGAAFDDVVEGGAVHDSRRIDYLYRHLEQAKRFIDEGGPLKGYYLWSFMDNFEWAFGYSKRFGMVYVDYETQERIVKDSGKWYSEQIAKHRSFEQV